MKVVGHCRFSYFGISDTGRSIRDIEAAENLLWNPERMAVRFHLFEHITLPSIRSQTDSNFLFAVISSEKMPAAYRDRLEALVEKDKNIRLIWTGQPSIQKATFPLMYEASNDGHDISLHFRLDDDDAVSADYVKMLRSAGAKCEPGSVITFARGIMGYLDGPVARHRPHSKFGIAIGYGILKKPDDFTSPFSIQHRRFAKSNLGYYDDDFLAFHYTRHSTNNTNGYEQRIHASGPTPDHIVQQSRLFAPELIGECKATVETDSAIHASFPFTDGPALRRVIEQTLEPEQLPAFA